MNNENSKDYLRKILACHASNLKNTSFDKQNNFYLCNDENTPDVFDFDEYVNKNFSHPTPASPDAICIGRNKIYFIEFKNQYASAIKKEKIKKKFQNGTRILKSLLSQCEIKDCLYIFCVVYKNRPRERYFQSSHIEEGVVRYGLAELNAEFSRFYDDVKTESVGFYVRNFEGLQCV
jgi:hypothetical protein